MCLFSDRTSLILDFICTCWTCWSWSGGFHPVRYFVAFNKHEPKKALQGSCRWSPEKPLSSIHLHAVGSHFLSALQKILEKLQMQSYTGNIQKLKKQSKLLRNMRSEFSPLLWVTEIYIWALLPVRCPLTNTEWRVKCRPCWHGAHTVLVAGARAVNMDLWQLLRKRSWKWDWSSCQKVGCRDGLCFKSTQGWYWQRQQLLSNWFNPWCDSIKE